LVLARLQREGRIDGVISLGGGGGTGGYSHPGPNIIAGPGGGDGLNGIGPAGNGATFTSVAKAIKIQIRSFMSSPQGPGSRGLW
jgi:hypothetical protein